VEDGIKYMSKFVNLHNHSNFSFLDGMSRIDEMVLRAKELGQTALALTDHGVMTGIVPFYKSCKKFGIKPILGMEAYFTWDLKAGTPDHAKGKNNEVNSHLIILAKNETGYRNLMKLASIGSVDNFYHRARVNTENLDKYREGLFITTACLVSPFRKAWMKEKPKDEQFDIEKKNPWIEPVERLFEIFEGNIAAEVQTYEHQDQYDYNKIIREEAKKRNIDLIVMGTVARTGIAGFFIGNTAENVLNQVDCSVLTVKPDEFVTPVNLD